MFPLLWLKLDYLLPIQFLPGSCWETNPVTYITNYCLNSVIQILPFHETNNCLTSIMLSGFSLLPQLCVDMTEHSSLTLRCGQCCYLFNHEEWIRHKKDDKLQRKAKESQFLVINWKQRQNLEEKIQSSSWFCSCRSWMLW